MADPLDADCREAVGQSINDLGLVRERKFLDRAGLLILITPRVIRTVEEGIQLGCDFEERIGQLNARMRETKGVRLKEDLAPVSGYARAPPAGGWAAAAGGKEGGATGTGRCRREGRFPGKRSSPRG